MFNFFSKNRNNFMILSKDREFVIDHKTKYPLFLYRYLHQKMITVIDAVFGGYPENKYIFYPPDDDLSDYFNEIRDKFLEIDCKPEFMNLSVTDIKSFQINSNYKFTSSLWESLKKDIHEEDQMLLKNTQFDYSLPDDLQVVFHRIDELVKEHVEIKNKILKANNIYPSDDLLQFGAKESDIKTIFTILSHVNGEWVKLKDISSKINNMSFSTIRININQIKNKIRDQHKEDRLRIENERQSAYRLIVS
jgi:hypothetical protein